MGLPERNSVFIPYMMSGSPDPAKIVWSGDWVLSHHLWDTLVSVSENGRILPALAEKWTRSIDGLVWSFDLRSDAKWSDGTSIKPDQAAASLSKSRGGTSHTQLSDAIQSINPTKTGVEIRLRHVLPTFLLSLTYVDWAIIHPSNWLEHSSSRQVEPKGPFSGPFILPQAKNLNEPVNEVHLLANLHHYRKPGVRLKSGELHFFGECEGLVQKKSQILAFRAFSGQMTSNCRKLLEEDFQITKSLPSWILSADFTKAGRQNFPTAERQKILVLLHEQLKSKNVSFGDGDATGLLPPHLSGSLDKNTYIAILALMKDETKRFRLSNKKIRLVTSEQWATWEAFGWLAKTLASQGYEIEKTVLKRGKYFEILSSGSIESDFDLNFIPIGVGDPDPNGTWQTAGKNFYPGLIDLNKVNRAFIEPDSNVRKALYVELGREFLRGAFCLPLRFESDVVGIHKSLKVRADVGPFRLGTTLYDLVSETSR